MAEQILKSPGVSAREIDLTQPGQVTYYFLFPVLPLELKHNMTKKMILIMLIFIRLNIMPIFLTLLIKTQRESKINMAKKMSK